MDAYIGGGRVPHQVWPCCYRKRASIGRSTYEGGGRLEGCVYQPRDVRNCHQPPEVKGELQSGFSATALRRSQPWELKSNVGSLSHLACDNLLWQSWKFVHASRKLLESKRLKNKNKGFFHEMVHLCLSNWLSSPASTLSPKVQWDKWVRTELTWRKYPETIADYKQ